MGEGETGQHGSGQGAERPGDGSVDGVAEPGPKDQQSGHGYPVAIGKAEVTAQGSNPRFVVTNLPAHGFPGDEDKTRFIPARLYEELYCGRGEMENMLKQQTLDLQADRMSTHYLASNQLRLWLSALACLLLERMLARATHAAFYVLLFAMPLTGWTMSSAN